MIRPSAKPFLVSGPMSRQKAGLAPPCFRRFAEGLQDTGYAAADDEDADQVIRLGKKGGHATGRLPWGLRGSDDCRRS